MNHTFLCSSISWNMMRITVHWDHKTTYSRRRGGLQTQALPRADSAVGSDWPAWVFFQSRCEMFPVMETVQPPWAAVPPLCHTQEERVFFLQPELCVFQLVLLPLNFPPSNTEAWFHLLHPLLPMSGMLLGVPEAVSSPSWTSLGSTWKILQDSLWRTKTSVVPPWWHPCPPTSSVYIEKAAWQL